jgi:DnaJ-class molecular chaperone
MAGAPIHIIRPPQTINTQITLEQAYFGCCIPVVIQNEETVYVTIPSGIDSNEVIFMEDKNCRISIQVNNTTPFQRNGLDLFYKKKISLKEALLGTIIEIPHLNGKLLTLNSHNHIIFHGYQKKIPDLGMIRTQSSGEKITGYLVIDFEVIFPESLTSEQLESLREIL